MSLVEIEAILKPMLFAIYGKYARCKHGYRFLYVWWDEGYNVWSKRYTKKEALSLIEHFKPIMALDGHTDGRNIKTMARTQKQDREWIIKMAEAESETLGGILVGSVL